ncbi:predicted protein, partial [Nematostella vectensis]
GTCIDGINNYTCRCHVGYKGALCDEKERICGEDTCYPGVKCREIPDGYECACPAGFNGSRCESDIDDCQPSLCVNGKAKARTCIDGINNYTCRCHVGYKGALCDE